ncbi:MAG: hypothetical protein JXA71_20455 [Chitinispirillaceae bacterium]|nr:hypothetical protein [Chitinispirillaceae bacterium]
MAAAPADSSDSSIALFPGATGFQGTSADAFRHSLFLGYRKERPVTRGSLGLGFPVLGLRQAATLRYCLGIAADVHLVMFPRDMKFAVDQFYATLAPYLEASPRGIFSFRLYPAYHVSAHLGDGHENDSAFAGARAVSSEMVKIEAACSPFPLFSASLGYGYYYHVCSQKPLSDLFDARFRYHYPVREQWRLSITVSGQAVCREDWHFGAEAEAGVYFINNERRGIGILMRWFDKTNSGYFYDKRDYGAGILIEFLPTG